MQYLGSWIVCGPSPYKQEMRPPNRPIHVFEKVSGLNRIYKEHRGALDVTAGFAFVYNSDKEDINHKDAKVWQPKRKDSDVFISKSRMAK